MLTAAAALVSATTFAATIIHIQSEAKKKPIPTSELWKIRAYQEMDAINGK